MLKRDDFDAVSFDVYGTILDWEPEVGRFLLDWADSAGMALPQHTLLEAYDRLRQPIQQIRPALPYPEVLARSLDAIGSEFRKPVSRTTRTAFSTIAATHRPFSDSAPALAELKATGLTLAALSNIDDSSFDAAMRQAGIVFDIVVTAERVGAYKPDHVHFETALADLSALGITSDRVLHVAQSLRADIVPANALGLTCVWVNRQAHVFGRTGNGAEAAKPDFEVASLAELAERLTD